MVGWGVEGGLVKLGRRESLPVAVGKWEGEKGGRWVERRKIQFGV